MTHSVFATREGLIGATTSSGYKVDKVVSFVALPSWKALHLFVRLTNPLTKDSTIAQVLDVGPWNEHDEDYVFGAARPQAETGTDSTGRTTNRAGIDLGEWVWEQLEMRDNGSIIWEFLI